MKFDNYMDYLKRINESKTEPNRLYSSDLLFLASLFEYFGTHSHGDVIIEGNTIFLNLYFYDENLIMHHVESQFDVQLCSEYYNRISKFVDEVL